MERSMTRHTVCRLLPFLLVLPMTAQSQPGNVEKIIYVSPSGNDGWSGTLTAPDPEKGDGPLLTPARAQTIVREMLSRTPGMRGSVSVMFRAGVYPLTRGLKFTRNESGNDSLTITWRAYGSERAVFTGGRSPGVFSPIRDSSVASRIRPSIRDSIFVVDLNTSALTDFGEIPQRGSPGMELFFKGERMALARWPNAGWLTIADVPQSGDSMFHAGLAREKRFDGVPAGRHYGKLRYDGERPTGWSKDNAVYLHGYWTFDWSDSYQAVSTIDTALHEIILAPPYHGYGYTKNQRYYFLNILEELDRPGEWILDRRGGKLYFWPPARFQPQDVVVSVLPEPFITLEECDHVTFQGITFEFGRTTGAIIRGGRADLFAGCTFRNLGGDAVLIDGGILHGVQSCDISEMSLGGITLRGGDRMTLTPAGHYASNNHIHHFGRWMRTGCYALIVDGVGSRLDHNLIHDAPFEAIYLRGNDHTLEYNEIHHVTQETGDAGAFHTGRNWTWQGNVIRFNYLHDLKGPGLHGVMGVYLDDWASGFHVYGNLFYRAGRATLIGGGRDNLVENNIYIECEPSVHVDARGLGWAGYYFDGSRTELFDQMAEVHFDRPPYSTRYPGLLRMYDGETAVPKYNRIVRNISWGGRWLDIYDFLAFDFSVVDLSNNLIADPDLVRRRKAGETGWDPYYLNIDMKEGYEILKRADKDSAGVLARNTILARAPGSFDPVTRTLTLIDTSAVSSIGFEPLPLKSMGLMMDRFRQSAR